MIHMSIDGEDHARRALRRIDFLLKFLCDCAKDGREQPEGLVSRLSDITLRATSYTIIIGLITGRGD